MITEVTELAKHCHAMQSEDAATSLIEYIINVGSTRR